MSVREREAESVLVAPPPGRDTPKRRRSSRLAASPFTRGLDPDSSRVYAKAPAGPFDFGHGTAGCWVFYSHAQIRTKTSTAVWIFVVGTNMSPSAYTELATAFAESGNIMVVLDPSHRNPVKYQKGRFAGCANLIKLHLLEWCQQQDPDSFRMLRTIEHWVVGGHSAGGYGVHEALCDEITNTDAVVSFDPFYSDSFPLKQSLSQNLPVPAFFWAFTAKSCGVDPSTGGSRFYSASQAHGVPCALLKLKSPPLTHCAVTNTGCAPVCKTTSRVSEDQADALIRMLHKDVATSCLNVLQALAQGMPRGWTSGRLQAGLHVPSSEEAFESFASSAS
mmetsp:Transcript_12580/g.45910  ORF Transcript_12580/g.45910 Transcript_12580/m.45910 type:complete len:334 (+) Transcript_12580:54-1055(+)